MATDETELAYYRAVEDLFAAARGVPHVLSPKDFQLLRGWWAEGVPLEAVAAGVAEVVARRRDSGSDGPVTSLGYCRHAVRRQAARLAAMRVGETAGAGTPSPDLDLAGAVAALGETVRQRAAAVGDTEGAVARVLEEFAGLVAAAAGVSPAEVESQLWALESAMLERCWRQLSEAERDRVEALARGIADASTDPTARERVERAARDRELRRRLGLPRLELRSGDRP